MILRTCRSGQSQPTRGGAESPIRHKSGLLTQYLTTVYGRWLGRKLISLISVQRPTINSRTASITVGAPESQLPDANSEGGGNYFRRKGEVRHKFDSKFSQAFWRNRKRNSNCLFFYSTCTSAASPVQPLRFNREPDYINNAKNKFAGVFLQV